MRRRHVIVLAVLLTASTFGRAQAIHRKQRAAPTNVFSTVLPSSIQVGSVTLDHCGPEPRYCGSLPRPLDPTGAVSGSISIYFEFYPHTDSSASALETIVAVEGGPGYPSTESRDGYLELFALLRDRRDMLLVDQR